MFSFFMIVFVCFMFLCMIVCLFHCYSKLLVSLVRLSEFDAMVTNRRSVLTHLFFLKNGK